MKVDYAALLGEMQVVENEVVDEGQMIVSSDARWVAVHPVTMIRLRMLDADPWEVFDAIAEWRLQRAVRTLKEKQTMREISLAFRLAAFEMNSAWKLAVLRASAFAAAMSA